LINLDQEGGFSRYPPRNQHLSGPQDPAQYEPPSTISGTPIVEIEYPGLAHMHYPSRDGQRPPRISMLSLSGYICKIPSFHPTGIILIIATSFWKHSFNRNEDQSQQGRVEILSIHDN